MTTVELSHGWVGSSAGPVTLVLHGGGPGCHSASDFAAVLARRPERRWLCVDLPGYGRSPRPASPSPEPLAYAADALHALLGRLEVENINVLAQSLGGSVTLRLAAEHTGMFRRLVVIGSQPTAEPDGRAGLPRDPDLGARARAGYYGGDGPSFEKMRSLMAELEWYDHDLVPESTVQNRHHSGTTHTALANAAGLPAEDLGAHLGSVPTPTLVVWGRHDPFAGPEYAAALADALPRGDLAVVGRTAHHPQSERPDAVAALAEAFFTHRS